MRGIFADYVVELNHWLQVTIEGNIAHELTWTMTCEGPPNKAVHRATANRRY